MSKEELAKFCPNGKITDIQCIDAQTGDDSTSLAEASCTVEGGLSCTSLPFPGIPPCHDYKIRYMCTCSANPTPSAGQFGSPTPSPSAGQFGSPTPSPSAGQFGSPTPSPSAGQFGSPTPGSSQPCVSGWSSWINEHSPVGTDGDSEKMSKEELAKFCPNGKITDIQCIDAQTGDDSTSLAEASCTVEGGLSCTSLPFPGIPPCHDYKIRYMCTCSANPTPSAGQFGSPTPSPSAGQFGSPTPSPSAGQFGSPTPSPSAGQFGSPTPSPSAGQFGSPTPSPSAGQFGSPTPSPSAGQFGSPTPGSSQPCVSGWSSWINEHSPVGTDGDSEKMSKEELAKFCPNGKITDIQCIDAQTGDDSTSLAEASCTVEGGLSCTSLPFPGIPPCHDYKIRYMCSCSDAVTATPVPPVSVTPNQKIQVNCDWSPWLNAASP
ncbi:nuclear pore complex protein DDB_G0274915, partial [Aplysia californica]|uniref:Nuclear pore complex protein DDB_G0274915 n=1 Tax=Aplysia californica TaxID=6500 RepID=A0ABM1W4Q0_APLCA